MIELIIAVHSSNAQLTTDTHTTSY